MAKLKSKNALPALPLRRPDLDYTTFGQLHRVSGQLTVPGMGSDDRALRASVRLRIASGALHKLASVTPAWAGHGSGHICKVCEAPVTESQIEYEFTKDARVFVHGDCLAIWRQESDPIN